MPNNKLYFSYVLQNFHKKSIHIKCYYLQKRKSLFKNDFFYSKLKNIPKGVRLTKCPVNKLDFGGKLRFLRKIVEGYPICPVNVFSYRRQINVALLLYFSIKIKTNKQQLKKSEAKSKQTISKLEKQQTKERKQNAKIYQT